ncbi:MAG: hypothetical protein IT448_12535 [Phycisphaerales bacterium]|nr:hypothetical protein [Phycisphaerales bacterium]
MLAIVSMLHEPAQLHSATRLFRGQPVLGWTLERLRQSRHLRELVVLCWEDQQHAAQAVARSHGGQVLLRGVRHGLAALDAVSASRRWSDGWRGGVYGTCAFDAGFYAPYVLEVMHDWASSAVVLVDPAAGLVDAELIDRLIEQMERKSKIEIGFSPAAAGLGGVVLRAALVERLAKVHLHPGRLLHYLPDQPMPDPLSGPGCLTLAPQLTRTRDHFLLNSDRQIDRVSRYTGDLNGQLVTTDALELARRSAGCNQPAHLPREVVLELTPRRATQPIFSPLSAHRVDRHELPPELAQKIFAELGACDDVRLTLAGVGDPLLHERAMELIALARQSGIRAIHIETDLIGLGAENVEQLAASGVDIISIHLPAMNAATYQGVMGKNGFAEVINNITGIANARRQRNSGVPLIVPVFMKLQANFAQMEPWYDNWLRLLGSAVIKGPSDYDGQINYVGMGDIGPAAAGAAGVNGRRDHRAPLMILSNGVVVDSENDFLGRQPMGNVASTSIKQIWNEMAGA